METEWEEGNTTRLTSAAYLRFAEKVAERAAGTGPPIEGRVMSSEFDLGGIVPRTEPYEGPLASEHVYIRLENKVYGPITRDDLNRLLTSGMLTGYESATIDFVRWTPLAYHPRMILAETVDPDATHDLLSGISDLPAPSAGKSALERAAEALDNEQPPQAAILIKPRRKKAPLDEDHELPLPLIGDLDKETIEEVFMRVSGEYGNEPEYSEDSTPDYSQQPSLGMDPVDVDLDADDDANPYVDDEPPTAAVVAPAAAAVEEPVAIAPFVAFAVVAIIAAAAILYFLVIA